MGTATRKQQERAIRRQDIVDAAERVFFARGFEHTSMDEVARESEFSKRTVYVYFNSKEQIYFEIMIRGYRALIDMVDDSLKRNPPANAADELRSIFRSVVAFGHDHSDYLTAIMEYETKDSEDRTDVTDESKEECYRLGEVLFGYLSRAVSRGVAEGTLRPGLDVRQTTLLLWACAVGVCNTAQKKGDYLRRYHSVEPSDFTAHSLELMLNLISADAGVPSAAAGSGVVHGARR